ncbi:MAG: tRNA (N(6)-L-threonylcarbamoyladenosine(37)-C(2))-methylthiotransferase MtaB [Desulfobacca sp.]|uniref:tRNA (N(6)-L-threonylcarbamoyladenosine(37)-C(2))- methylthiotransferase MtaB n=1 Tax=Desulfobacca sp. TaxID=2067990 RepID=UPI004049EE2D
MSEKPLPQSGGRRLAVLTFGCKVNQYESAYLAEQAEAAGWQLATPESADLLVVNSCTVTGRADRQVRQALRQAGRRQPPPRLVVTGCYAQRAPAELAAFPGVQAVLGNAAKACWPEIAARLRWDTQAWTQVSPMAVCRQLQPLSIRTFAGHTRAFVKIQDGCVRHCTYCLVPQVRGPERSLAPARVLEQLRLLIQQGCQELVLTGINLSRYGCDLAAPTSLASLCGTLQATGWPVRLRLSSLEPLDITSDLLQVLKDWEYFCPHFHIPLQSGCDEVLQAMGRPYRAAWFVELVQEVRRHFPAAAIGLDVLVGFPTETAAAFARTRELLAGLPLTYLHVFPYSPRPGTPAAALTPQVGPQQISAWSRELRLLAAAKKHAFYQGQIGQVVEVLVEGEVAGQPGLVSGLTANYLRVHCPGPPTWANRVVRVRLEKLAGGVLFGLPLT